MTDTTKTPHGDGVPITDEAVDRACEAMARAGWLPLDWDGTPEHCPTCGHISLADGDGGAAARAEVRRFLLVALGGDCS